MRNWFSFRYVIAVLIIASLWIWNRYGNFKDLLKSVGIDGFQLFLIVFMIFSLFKVYEFRKETWYIRFLPLIPVFIVGLTLLEWITISNLNLVFLNVAFAAGIEFMPEKAKSPREPGNIEN